jgi:hypothetical protein
MYYYLILGCNREKIDSLNLEYYDGHSLLKKRIIYRLLICYFNNSFYRVRRILTMVFKDSSCIGIEDEMFFSRIDTVALSKLSTI